MKQSNYNFFFPFELDENKILAYNARSSALALMDVDHYNQFIECVEGGKEITDESFMGSLRMGGYVVDDHVNELDFLRYEIMCSRYSTRTFALTIAPTLNCNFECTYCYEKGSKHYSTMSVEVQEMLIERLEQQIPYIESFSTTWYGGEPLLAMDVIENLSKRFMEICQENNKNYSSYIVTNGYLLSKDIAQKLKSFNITGMQVTLDGPPHIHNVRRPLCGGQETFDRILERIGECIGIIDNIALRINTDKENESFISELYKRIETTNLRKNVSVYLGYVESQNGCYCNDLCMDFKDYAKLSLDFNKMLIEEGFSNNYMQAYPYAKRSACTADSESSYVVDPEGKVYSCWSDIGIEKYCIGAINNEQNSNIQVSNRLVEYMLYDPTQDAECAGCKFLPLCIGGCPRRRLEKSADRCTEHKHTLNDYIKGVALNLYKNRTQQAVSSED